MSADLHTHEDPPHLVILARHRNWALIAGLVALAGCFIGVWVDPQPMLAAYLTAWLYFVGLTLGALAALMVHHLTGGDWGRPVRRYFEAMLAPLLLLAVLFVPLALGLRELFAWAREPSEGYLSSGLFVARAVAFFALWLLFARLLVRAGRDQKRAIGVSAAGLIIYVVTATLAATDWIASLTPRWASTNLGLIVVTGQCLGAMAAAVAAAAGLSATRLSRDPAAEPWQVTPERGNDLGNLLLTFVMTWMYLEFMQLLIIWAEDLPHETSWYLPRLQGEGRYLALALMIAQFAIPFTLLLFRQIKRDIRTLCAIAWWLLFAHLLDAVWLILPSVWDADRPVAGALWRVVLAVFGVGGLWLFLAARDLAHRPTFAHAALDAREEAAVPEVRPHG